MITSILRRTGGMVPVKQENCFGLLSAEPVDFISGPVTQIWAQSCAEAIAAAELGPVVTRMANAAVLYHASFGQALAHRVAQKLGSFDLGQDELQPFICQAFLSDPRSLPVRPRTWPPSAIAIPAIRNS